MKGQTGIAALLLGVILAASAVGQTARGTATLGDEIAAGNRTPSYAVPAGASPASTAGPLPRGWRDRAGRDPRQLLSPSDRMGAR
ncbi:MAG TPA: hypothetical protein VFJ58_03435 [Armatimonadota bacterium]|nr:hypothetical protein [Armatimonadota bacterium]